MALQAAETTATRRGKKRGYRGKNNEGFAGVCAKLRLKRPIKLKAKTRGRSWEERAAVRYQTRITTLCPGKTSGAPRKKKGVQTFNSKLGGLTVGPDV